MTPVWTILVATLGQRHQYLCQLLDGLLPQVDAQHGQVNVLAYWDNGEKSIAVKRQALLDAADGEYLSFVDDDDTVSDDYVAAIMEALATRPDYVGFKMQVYQDGAPFALSHHSLRHDGWNDAADTPRSRRARLHEPPGFADYLRRDITTSNPMRTDIARTAKFAVARGEIEDRPWVNQLRGRLKTEVFVDRVLYHYWWVPSQSAWIHPDRQIRATDPAGRAWPVLDVASPHFAWHPDSPLPEGDPRGGPAHHRPGTHPHLEHPPPAGRVGPHARVGRRRRTHRG